jgi:hypothetical protein
MGRTYDTHIDDRKCGNAANSGTKRFSVRKRDVTTVLTTSSPYRQAGGIQFGRPDAGPAG